MRAASAKCREQMISPSAPPQCQGMGPANSAGLLLTTRSPSDGERLFSKRRFGIQPLFGFTCDREIKELLACRLFLYVIKVVRPIILHRQDRVDRRNAILTRI